MKIGVFLRAKKNHRKKIYNRSESDEVKLDDNFEPETDYEDIKEEPVPEVTSTKSQHDFVKYTCNLGHLAINNCA